MRDCSPFLVLTTVLGLAAGCDDGGGSQGPFATPDTVMPASEIAPIRGYTVRRGITHLHSVYSHDACDDAPFTDGVRNESCLQDLRRGLCATGQEYACLSDHATLFAEYEFPDVLLHAAGDTLVERGGLPVANRVACEGGGEVLVLAGTETGMMPLGIERHPAGTIEERKAAYGLVGPEGVLAMHALGAQVFLHHTEEWTIEQVTTWPIDGIEVYNTHRNIMDRLDVALELVLKLESEPESLPDMDLLLQTIFQENAPDLERWARAVQTRRMPAVLATDAHQNVFQGQALDGERIDAYRRMLRWFANYTLVPTGAAWDDLALKEALGQGHTFGVFTDLGYPVGFDFHAEADGVVYEVGSAVPASSGVRLTVRAPSMYRLDPAAEQPVITVRLLQAEADGTWREVAAGPGDLEETVGAGVYRAEVRMLPNHWRPLLGAEPERWLIERPWIYANPIYVGRAD
ncbi:MAG TPA: hypothetical protein PK668_09515 [Myxococcota bacterium]|nr:hypothetical protein [Myxococcota bacterium]HRY92780.1 hypothetical protein [Myxococcota bacterium]HSA20425.1 hypothetical protein [Myxococcota bacterium]